MGNTSKVTQQVKLQKLAEKIRFDNAEFKAAEPRQKAVLIAKDVIKHINTNKIQVTPGEYFNSDRLFQVLAETDLDEDHQVQDIYNTIPDGCEVCAIGACFLVGVKRFNKLTLGDVGDASHPGDSVMRKYLCEYFTPQEIIDMECVFENDKYGFSGDVMGVDVEASSKALKVCAELEYKNDFHKCVAPQDRLKLIMQTIIDCDGYFDISYLLECLRANRGEI